MDSKEKLVERGKQLYQRFIDNIGKKNFEKRLKENPEEYIKVGDINKLINDTQSKKANIYKGYKIPMSYTGKTVEADFPNLKSNNPSHVYATTYGNFIYPKTFYHKNTGHAPLSRQRIVIGHELGHAKNRLKLNLKQELEKINKLKNKGKIKKADIYTKKAIQRIDKKYKNINQEAEADKNISTYLKQMNIPKNERRAHYYLIKNYWPNKNGRYQSKFGNLKYLKDYIFGFSNPTRNS